MAKTKEQRKQEKKISTQNEKKVQESKQTSVKTQAQAKSAGQTRTVTGPEQITLTMYTLISMIVTFISAGVTVVAMVIYAKPLVYVLKSTVGSVFNTYSLEAIEQLMFEENPDLPVYGLYLGVAALVAAGAVLTLISLVKAVNEFNKPNIVVSIVAVVFAVAALVLFIYSDGYTKDAIREYGFGEQPIFSLYSLYLPFLIANVVAMACNVLATALGLKRWKNTGRTSKE